MRRSNSSLRLLNLGYEIGMSYKDILYFTYGQITEMWLERKAGEINRWREK